jgi:hypothetical protein
MGREDSPRRNSRGRSHSRSPRRHDSKIYRSIERDRRHRRGSPVYEGSHHDRDRHQPLHTGNTDRHPPSNGRRGDDNGDISDTDIKAENFADL